MNKILLLGAFFLMTAPLAADQQQECEAIGLDPDVCRAETGGGSGDLDAEIPRVMDSAGAEE